MPSTYHVHPEFGYFCLTPYRRRELLVAVVSILFGAMIGGSIATLRAAHGPNPNGVSTASRVDLSNSERVPVAAAEATPVAPTDADTKVAAKESIKPFPLRRVRVRPAVPSPLSPAVDPATATQAGVVASASPPVEPSERAPKARNRQPLHLTRRSRRRRSGLPLRSRSSGGSHTFKAVAAMKREMFMRGTAIVRTTGLAAPMSMLTICAPNDRCSEGSSCNDHPVGTQSLDSAWAAS